MVNGKAEPVNKGQTGFTLVEMLLVLLIIASLVSLAAPMITRHIAQAKDAAQSENISVMRRALDAYFSDHGYYPDRLEKLTDDKYLRFIPMNPVTNNDQWFMIKNSEGGIEEIEETESSDRHSYEDRW